MTLSSIGLVSASNGPHPASVILALGSEFRNRLNGGAVDCLFFGNIMPLEKSSGLKVTTSNSRKRKSDCSISSSNKKPRQTLDTFFAPRVSVPSGNSKERNLVTLDEEQRKVLRLVVDEGKSVFFTGSAGAFLLLSFGVGNLS